MRTIPVASAVPADFSGAIAVAKSAGVLTIYYAGDLLPQSGQTPQQIAEDEAARKKDRTDFDAAGAYAKLQSLVVMSPAQVQAWVAANVTNLAQAQDAIATLATAVSVLARGVWPTTPRP